MSVRNGLVEDPVFSGEDFFAKPLSEFHYTLLMTRWAEMAPLVTLKRDFRFAPTQMPVYIHVHIPRISLVQISCTGYRSLGSDK